MILDRTNTSFFGQWWWTVDRMTLLLLSIILSIGTVLVMASSPSIADSRGLPHFYFVQRQTIFLVLAIITTFIVSLLSPIYIRRLSLIGLFLCLILLAATFFLGPEIKGAKRWVHLFGFNIQPSEFIKPFFIVITAWILAMKNTRESFNGYIVSGAIWISIIAFLVAQPDIGMSLIISIIWGIQLFLAGLPMMFVIAGVFFGVGAFVVAYFFLPHVAGRIDSFFDPSMGDSYQSEKALEAFINGGLFGQGPGEGSVKDILPDAHTDFIFAVAGEELGLITCFIIVMLYASVVARGFLMLFKETDLFIIYAASGLLIQFGLQALINMGVSLNLLPNTGVTLPFMSYGGSSMISMAIAMGMVLSFTRKRYGNIKKKYG